MHTFTFPYIFHHLDSNCAQATSVVAGWLYDVNKDDVCAKDPSSNTYTHATCFVEGLGESSVVHYTYETTTDSTCATGLAPAGDSATCLKDGAKSYLTLVFPFLFISFIHRRVQLTCNQYYKRTVTASNFNGMGLVAGSASFQYSTCDTARLYNFNFVPIDSCDNYVSMFPQPTI